MPIQIVCPSCGRVGQVPDLARGHSVRCPGCREKFRVGEPAPVPDWVESIREPQLAPPPPIPTAIVEPPPAAICVVCGRDIRRARECRECGETACTERCLREHMEFTHAAQPRHRQGAIGPIGIVAMIFGLLVLPAFLIPHPLPVLFLGVAALVLGEVSHRLEGGSIYAGVGRVIGLLGMLAGVGGIVFATI